LIAIRGYRDTDLAATALLWLQSWRSTGLAVALKPGEAELYVHNLERIPRELAAGWELHLAWDNAKLVGFLALNPTAQQVAELFVLPEAQGRGIGALLLDFAKAALSNGFWLRTAVDNARACRFYERNGCRRGEVARHPSLDHETVTYHWP
jgi:ribosomal protein S18 acetylase RimI-like enzyme